MTSITATLTTNTGDTVNGVALSAVAMPALTGSTKQIVWAEKIRSDAIQAAAEALGWTAISATTNGIAADKLLPSLDRATSRLAAKLDGLTAAAWWIDNVDALTASKVIQTITKG